MQKSLMLISHNCYGLPKILSILSKVDVVSKDLQYNASASAIVQHASAIVQHAVCNISSTIESNLEWPTPTNDVRPVVTEPLGMVASRSQN
jgi:hypothetical protein